MRNRGVERYVALALWIRGNFPKRDRNRTPVGVVAAVARSHYLKQERDYEDTMQAAEIKVIEWLSNPSSAPDGLIDCYNFLVEERNRGAIRKRRPTKTEVALLAMGYALGGTFFLGQHDITKRLCAIGVKTSRTTVRDAMAKLEGVGVIRKVKGPSFQKRHATEFGLEVPAQPSPAASHLWRGLFDSPALWRARKQRQPNLRLAVTGRPSLSGYPGVWGRDKTESDNVGSGGGIRSSFKKHWQKEDILTAASGREFEIIRELCGISNLKRQINKGQSCPNCHGFDRFCLSRKRGGESFVAHCRKCDWKGADIIQVIQDLCCVGFQTALEELGLYLGVEPKIYEGRSTDSRRQLAESHLDSIQDKVAKEHGLKDLNILGGSPHIRTGKEPWMLDAVYRVPTYGESPAGKLGQVSYFDLGMSGKKIKKGLNQTDVPSGFFAPANQQINRGDHVVIVEGCKDGVRLSEIVPGIKWIGTNGCSFGRQTQGVQKLLKGCQIVLLADGDHAGVNAYRKLAEQLGKTAASIRLESVVDESELVVKDGKGVREAAFSEAGIKRLKMKIQLTMQQHQGVCVLPSTLPPVHQSQAREGFEWSQLEAASLRKKIPWVQPDLLPN